MERKKSVHPDGTAWSELYAVVRRKTGLDLDKYCPHQLQRRILSMVRAQSLADLGEFSSWLASNKGNMRWFLDKMAINVSSLFRNPEKWYEIQSLVLPELLAEKTALRAWSAGCSYGAEAYSLAMILDLKFHGGRHQILGTDIDVAALEQAKRGEFSESDVQGMPDEYRRHYLRKQGQIYKAVDTLRPYLNFRRGNLLADRFSENFDLILCRNVVIYLTEEAKNTLYERLVAALRPGGYLFIGPTEQVTNAEVLELEMRLPFIYRKGTQPHERKWRYAS